MQKKSALFIPSSLGIWPQKANKSLSINLRSESEICRHSLDLILETGPQRHWFWSSIINIEPIFGLLCFYRNWLVAALEQGEILRWGHSGPTIPYIRLADVRQMCSRCAAHASRTISHKSDNLRWLTTGSKCQHGGALLEQWWSHHKEGGTPASCQSGWEKLKII